MATDRLNVLETRLRETAQIQEAKPTPRNKSLKFSEKRKKLAERKKQHKAIKNNLKLDNPPPRSLNSLIRYYQNKGDFRKRKSLRYPSLRSFPSIHLHGKFWVPY